MIGLFEEQKMFFIFGISDGSKEFDFTQTDLCGFCGRYGRYIVYMTYTAFSLFFIPCFKWNKQYYVRMSCCGKTYRLDPEVGKQITRGEEIKIRPEDLEEVSDGWESNGISGRANWNGGWESGGISSRANWNGETKKYSNCGYTTTEDFDFCPKCGNRL